MYRIVACLKDKYYHYGFDVEPLMCSNACTKGSYLPVDGDVSRQPPSFSLVGFVVFLVVLQQIYFLNETEAAQY
jgi:hypothetical protein